MSAAVHALTGEPDRFAARPCVILDIGGVLKFTPQTRRARRRMKVLKKLPTRGVKRLNEIWHAGSIGSISEEEVNERLGAELGLDAPQVEALMALRWKQYLGIANEELIAYVRTLAGRCTLGILSNSFVGAREREEERYHFSELVQTIVYSHEIGVEKPDRRAYEAACAALSVHPHDCLFVDDLAVNVAASRQAGIHGHLFTGNAQTIARIESHLDTRSEEARA